MASQKQHKKTSQDHSKSPKPASSSQKTSGVSRAKSEGQRKARSDVHGYAPAYARPIFLVDGARTPFLKARGKPGPFSAVDLAVGAGKPLLLRQAFAPEDLDQVVLGCVMPTAEEANPARVAALRLGCDESIPAQTVQRNCASGMQAIDSAALEIAAGRADLILAGGVEAMSRAPLLWNDKAVQWLGGLAKARSPGARLQMLSQLRASFLKPVIALLEGLTDPFTGLSMGQTTEQIAWRFGVDREAMDRYALASHQRLAAAQADMADRAEIEPLYAADGRVYQQDDGVRADSRLQDLQKLKPVFDRLDGKVTAGNSAQVSDGAAWLILASEEAVTRYDLQPLGRLLGTRWAGLDPAEMGLGPVHAVAPLLQDHKLSVSDIDYWEINEAFAGQVLSCRAAMADPAYCQQILHLPEAMGELDTQHLNVDGGGISLGHPLGASGARIVLHLLQLLKGRGARRGIASLCIGGGQGGAMLIEREIGS